MRGDWSVHPHVISDETRQRREYKDGRGSALYVETEAHGREYKDGDMPLPWIRPLSDPGAVTATAPGSSQEEDGMSLGCEEESALPANSAPQPSTVTPDQAEAHPLLDISLTPDKGGGILRRQTSERSRRSQRQVRFDVGDQGRPEAALPGALAAPRMHSSSALRFKVQREARQEFDAESAVQNELGRSFAARRSVQSEAARALNVSRVQNLYQGLVSVEPPAEHLQRLTAQHRRTEHHEVSPIEGPDLFAFSDPCQRFTETPYLGVDGLPAFTLEPRTRPPHSVFDMFHKLGEWAS
ncbi:protein phosphatase 1 regulatory subunit 35 [Pseudophryne corroboree]|uniref:protein phosphatase 1 regulatory subunit 35 n=1 Tax=Pseudophryne corroboree TaxID=495146 RepID=UPI0030821F91